MEKSWYQVKQSESRYQLSSMANDGLLGMKIVEAKQRVGTAIKFSDAELKRLLQRGQSLVKYILDGVEFLRGTGETKSLDPELVLVLNNIRCEDYLSLDDIEQRCKVVLNALQMAEKGKPDLEKLKVAEGLFSSISNSTKSEEKILL